MAAIATIRGLLRALAARYRRSATKFAAEAEQWAVDLADVPDEKLTAYVQGWSDERHPPTLAQTRKALRKLGVAPASALWPSGCQQCGETGRRTVMRHRDDGRIEEVAGACSCALGQARHDRQRLPFVADVVTAWSRSSSTADGPFIDPVPTDRLPLAKRPAAIAAAERRLEACREQLGQHFRGRQAASAPPPRWEAGEIPL